MSKELLAHLKGPVKEGKRENTYFPTKAKYIEDFAESVKETECTTKLIAGASNSTVNAATTNGNTHLRLFDDDTARSSIKIAGSGATTVTSDANGNITINSTDNNTVYTHPTTSGNKHIPSGGSSGQFLKWSADGTAVWAADNDTHHTALITAGASNTTTNASTTNGNTYLKLIENNTKRSALKISGSGATTVTSDANGNITINSTDNNTVYTHPTTSGNKHIPSGGSSGQFLKWSADGTAVWAADNDTHHTALITAGASNTTTNASTTNGNTYLKLIENNTKRSALKISGSGATTVTSDANGNITINSTDNNTVYTHPTTSGNKHIPSGGSSGQILTWSADGTAVWANQKGTLTVSDKTVTLARGEVKTLTATGNTGGAITATSNSTGVATASASGSTITLTGVAAGTATITIAQAAGSGYSAPTSIAITVTVSDISKDLDNNFWATISTVSKAGNGDLYWDIGDSKAIVLNGKVGSQLTLTKFETRVFILDFNHKMNGSAENNIIWGGFKDADNPGKDIALIDAKYDTISTDGTICFNMNHWGNFNYGGWKGSDFRYDVLGATSTQPSGYGAAKTTSCVGYDATAATLTSPKADTLLAALPSDLRAVMRLWTRWVDAVGNSSNVDANIKATVDAITLLSEQEIFGSRTYANQYEKNHNTIMAYYANGNSRVRYKHNDTSISVRWWESSPRYNNSSSSCAVYSSGSVGEGYAHSCSAVAPAFKT